MDINNRINVLLSGILLTVLATCTWSCEKETPANRCVKGTVIGQGCLTGSYAILLEGKNSQYGIAESLTYDNVVETLNLPDEYKVNGTQIYFTFTKPTEELGKYLTYCTPAPQITLVNVSKTSCPITMNTQPANSVLQ